MDYYERTSSWHLSSGKERQASEYKQCQLWLGAWEQEGERLTGQIRKALNEDKTRTEVAQEMLQTVLYEREPTMRKAMSRLT